MLKKSTVAAIIWFLGNMEMKISHKIKYNQHIFLLDFAR